jgi:hypothetical protein
MRRAQKPFPNHGQEAFLAALVWEEETPKRGEQQETYTNPQ